MPLRDDFDVGTVGMVNAELVLVSRKIMALGHLFLTVGKFYTY
jgi:hypothetical protein